jgi:hypothetical protein
MYNRFVRSGAARTLALTLSHVSLSQRPRGAPADRCGNDRPTAAHATGRTNENSAKGTGHVILNPLFREVLRVVSAAAQ